MDIWKKCMQLNWDVVCRSFNKSLNLFKLLLWFACTVRGYMEEKKKNSFISLKAAPYTQMDEGAHIKEKVSIYLKILFSSWRFFDVLWTLRQGVWHIKTTTKWAQHPAGAVQLNNKNIPFLKLGGGVCVGGGGTLLWKAWYLNVEHQKIGLTFLFKQPLITAIAYVSSTWQQMFCGSLSHRPWTQPFLNREQ